MWWSSLSVCRSCSGLRNSEIVKTSRPSRSWQMRLERLLSTTSMSSRLIERLFEEVKVIGSIVVELATGSAAVDVAVMASRLAFRWVCGGATGASVDVKEFSCCTACCDKARASRAIHKNKFLNIQTHQYKDLPWVAAGIALVDLGFTAPAWSRCCPCKSLFVPEL